MDKAEKGIAKESDKKIFAANGSRVFLQETGRNGNQARLV